MPEEHQAVGDGGELTTTVPDLELRQVDPDEIAVDEMNERVDEPLQTEDLERSVAENGVVEPPVCRVRDADAQVPYTVVQGQRRVAAAQAVQLEEIPILVGEFDDKRALIRSITENIKAGQKDVTTKTRAAAIWELWKLIAGPDPDNIPSAGKIADLLGVHRSTASGWMEPLKAEYADTVIDPRVTDETDVRHEHLSEKVEDIDTDKLQKIRTVAGSEEVEDVVEAVVEADLSQKDVRAMTKLPEATDDPIQAVEQVRQAKEAEQEARGFMLDRMRFGDETGGAIQQAARATGKDKSAVIKDAVQYYLREEGYLE